MYFPSFFLHSLLGLLLHFSWYHFGLSSSVMNLMDGTFLNSNSIYCYAVLVHIVAKKFLWILRLWVRYDQTAWAQMKFLLSFTKPQLACWQLAVVFRPQLVTYLDLDILVNFNLFLSIVFSFHSIRPVISLFFIPVALYIAFSIHSI